MGVHVLRAAIADAHHSLAWQTRLVAASNAIEILAENPVGTRLVYGLKDGLVDVPAELIAARVPGASS